MQQELAKFISFLKQTFDFLNSNQLQSKLLPLKIACLIFLAGFIVITVYLLYNSSWFSWTRFEDSKNFFLAPYKPEHLKIKRTWHKIKKGVEKESSAKRKLALLKARSLLLKYLKRGGYPGVDLAERINNLPEGCLSNAQELISAEKVCQSILKDPNYQLSKDKAKKVAQIFGRTFLDLELL